MCGTAGCWGAIFHGRRGGVTRERGRLLAEQHDVVVGCVCTTLRITRAHQVLRRGNVLRYIFLQASRYGDAVQIRTPLSGCDLLLRGSVSRRWVLFGRGWRREIFTVCAKKSRPVLVQIIQGEFRSRVGISVSQEVRLRKIGEDASLRPTLIIRHCELWFVLVSVWW